MSKVYVKGFLYHVLQVIHAPFVFGQAFIGIISLEGIVENARYVKWKARTDCILKEVEP